MNFFIKKKELIKMLKFSECIINKNKLNYINPILNYSYLDVNYEQSKIICSNNNTTAKYLIDKNQIKINKSGKILINQKLILEIVNKLVDEEIEFNKVDNSVLLLKTKTYNAQINIINENQYPIDNIDFDLSDCINLSIENIEEIIQKISWSTLNLNDQSNVLNGVYFDTAYEQDFLTCIGTDSFKLTYLKQENMTNLKTNFILDNSILKIMSEINKISNIKKYQFFVNDVGTKKIIIKQENITLINKPIIGDYPFTIFNKAFNIDVNTEILISKKELTNALERGKIFVINEKNPMVTLQFKNDKLEIEFNSYQYGNSKEEIEIKELKGNPITISFNANYLINLLNVIEDEVINLKMESNLKPMLIFSSNKNFKELILPMRNN